MAEITDFDRLKDLLTEWGINFDEWPVHPNGREVIIYKDENPALATGICGSSCSFDFDQDGNFVLIGFDNG